MTLVNFLIWSLESCPCIIAGIHQRSELHVDGLDYLIMYSDAGFHAPGVRFLHHV